MRKLTVFNNVTIDGFFTDPNGDMSWAHNQDPEWLKFAEENSKTGGELVFGRVTYEMMAGYWPTPVAAKNAPELAEHMNSLPKIVFSKTLDEATWNNTRLLKGDLAGEVRKLKQESGDQLVIMGSGTIVSQLAEGGLIDAYQIVVHPLVLGDGRTMFETVKDKLKLKLTNTRTFQNGNVVLSYDATA